MKLLHNLSGSPEVSLLVLAMTICMQYIVHLQIAPDEAYQADVSMDFHTRLEQPPKVKFYARVSSRVSFLYLRID